MLTWYQLGRPYNIPYTLGVTVPDQDPDILAQFQEFLAQKEASAKEEAEKEDFDIEFWDEKGRGVRTKRSHAKPFLQQFGIDLDPKPEGDNSGDKGDGGTKTKSSGNRQSTGKSSNATGSQSTVRKYFVKGTAPK
jgi:hypothetical protein